VSRPTLIAIEKGSRAPKPRELVQLAALYGRRVSTLVRPGAEPQPIAPHLRATLGDALDAELAAVIAEHRPKAALWMPPACRRIDLAA
jgi:transcriptional regulator with XRE-family HTH domain